MDAKKLLHDAMQKGYVTSQSVVIVLIGIAGSGKSSFKRVVLDLPLEEKRVSTALTEGAIHNISISRADAVGDPDSVKWEAVNSDKLLEMLANAIKEGVTQESTGDLSSTSKIQMEQTGSSSSPPSPVEAMALHLWIQDLLSL